MVEEVIVGSGSGTDRGELCVDISYDIIAAFAEPPATAGFYEFTVPISGNHNERGRSLGNQRHRRATVNELEEEQVGRSGRRDFLRMVLSANSPVATCTQTARRESRGPQRDS